MEKAMKKETLVKRAEILAPAGAMEQLYAAVRCGADAVYLGATGFNARRNAANFDKETLPQAVSYCHGRGVKVHVTVNTLVMDSELRELEETAELLAMSGVDAVIIQDLAVLELFKKRYPTIERHCSTQAAVHNVDGARFMEELGFQNVVLARELTLEEMHAISKAVNIKTEAFVHGAHCMGVSGACYLSGMLGGRSGNRGLCAQPCRLDWRTGKKDYALSLKDMSLISHLNAMQEAGVSLFKIEGRMKRPEYVAAAVTACCLAREGKDYDEDTLRKVFSRSGFTDGYLMGRRGADMYGSRSKEDVVGAEKVFKDLQQLYKAETPRVSVDIIFNADENGSSLVLSDGEHTISVEGETPQRALNRPMDEESARKNLCKLGGTPFAVGSFAASVDNGLMLPASALNALRRAAAERLLEERSRIRPHERREWSVPAAEPHAAAVQELWARFYRVAQIPANEDYDRVILPLGEIDAGLIARYGQRLCGELPAVCFPEDEAALEKRLAALHSAGLEEVMADNIYGIALARRLGLRVRGGFGLNLLNSRALALAEDLGLQSATVSFELAMGKVRALGGRLPRGIIAFGHLPLMRWRNCPVKAFRGCGDCGGRGELTDRLGVRFGVECGERRFASLLNSVPLHIAERDLRGLDYLLLYFTRESAADCQRITEDFRLRRKSEGKRTGGLYYRELL